jgi:prohibitin 2
LVFNRIVGLKSEVQTEGTHVVLPWFEWPIIFDIRTRPRAIKSQTGTRDLQMVDIGLRVLTRPDPTKLRDIYRRTGLDYDDKILPSIVNEVLKQVIAQFNATALLTQREQVRPRARHASFPARIVEHLSLSPFTPFRCRSFRSQVSRKIKQNLEDRAREFDLVLEDVSITDLKFGREFEKAVESKQVAQQDAERARFIVEKALQDKRSIVIKAQGEAKAAEMIGKAVANNPGFVQLRKIDAAREIAATVANSANLVYLPADSLLLSSLGMSNAAPSAGSGAPKK